MILSFLRQTASSDDALSPRDIGPIHFVGIGGIGMSGIAEILHALGYIVQGSDLAENASVKRLRDKGIKVFLGHDGSNVAKASVVVMSSAVKRDNPEIAAARAAFVPVVRRAEMLGELMRLKRTVGVGGTHGKTTTTSMIASLFDAAGLDPTVVNGGVINAYGSNARLGKGAWMVVETDESDGSFTRLPSTVTIVTNMDPEHMEHYGTFDAVRAAYATFVENIPFYGFAVLCADHPEVRSLAAKVEDRRVVTYGFSETADVRPENLVMNPDGSGFDVLFSCRKTKTTRVVAGFHLPVIGRHNVQNALAALTVGWQLGFSDDSLRQGLGRFEGVKRRFTKTGCIGGVTIVDDYAHHPNEIRATLAAARQARGEKGRTIAVVQPHRFTRLRDLFDDFRTCFDDAEIVVVAEVYPAGEKPIEGVSGAALVDVLNKDGRVKKALFLPSPEALAPLIAKEAEEGDYVLCLGAGSVSKWAHDLPAQLEALADA